MVVAVQAMYVEAELKFKNNLIFLKTKKFGFEESCRFIVQGQAKDSGV